MELTLHNGDTLVFKDAPALVGTQDINLAFVSNTANYTKIVFGADTMRYQASEAVVVYTYSTHTWNDAAYKTIQIDGDQTITDEYTINWLYDNVASGLPARGFTYKNIGTFPKTYYNITIEPGQTVYDVPGYINDPTIIRVLDLSLEAKHTVVFTEAYKVTFLNWDESLISSDLYVKDTVLEPADPTRPEDELYTYTFKGWDPALEPVTEDATYTATYTAVAK